MKSRLIHRGLWLAATAGLVFSLLWLDQHRGGPASMLSRCNLLLSRSETPAADVLIIGSSRSGTAFDPVAMQEMFEHAIAGDSPTVERIAMAHSPLRAGHALLENYLEGRGAPKVIALEIMFLSERSVERLEQQELAAAPEQTIFRRDLNLMTFGQILKLPSVAMPFSEGEGRINLWRFRLRGVVLRAGALAYQFLRGPTESWQLSTCDQEAWTKESVWPPDFAFSYGDFEPNASPTEEIENLTAIMDEAAPQRALKSWQTGVSTDQHYPYDFGETYREGELTLLNSMLEMASRHGIKVVLLPLPLYGYTAGDEDMHLLAETLPKRAHIFDVYGQVQGDLSKFWYDDGHVERYPAGALTTAILAQHILNTGLQETDAAGLEND